MVLPSPSQIYAAKVREVTELGRDLFISGEIVGGGALASALKKHVEKGLRVVISENAAYTIRNDLDEVRELGIEVIPGEELKDFKGEKLRIEERRSWKKLKRFLQRVRYQLKRSILFMGIRAKPS